MRFAFYLPVLGLLVASVDVMGQDSLPAVPKQSPAALEKRIADLEKQLAAVQKEVNDLRRALQLEQTRLKGPVLTPEEAVRAFLRNPGQPVTVEFGVGSAGWLDGPMAVGDDPTPPIQAVWDGWLPGGGRFSLLLTGKSIRGLPPLGGDGPPPLPEGLIDLKRVNQICKHLKAKGVRVTGFIRASQPNWSGMDYTIVVDDAVNFAINK